MSVGIAGAGRVAQALGRRLQESGQHVRAIASRSFEHAAAAAKFIGGDVEAVSLEELVCDRILVAVSDDAIVDVAGRLPKPKVVLHTSGANGAELLAFLRERGGACGSLHPLQSFATPEAGYRDLPGIAFAMDGDPLALAWAEEIVILLDGSILRIPAEFRSLYHAAAAMASNHLISIVDAAVQTMARAGVPEEAALRALAPIMQTSLRNAIDLGPMRALTGPVERGDLATVAMHLNALETVAPSIRDLYRAASLQAVQLVRRRNREGQHA